MKDTKGRFAAGGVVMGGDPVIFYNDPKPGESPEVVMPLDKLKIMLPQTPPTIMPKSIDTHIQLSPEIIPLFNHDPLEVRRNRMMQLQMKKMDSHLVGDESFTEQDQAELEALYALAEAMSDDYEADEAEPYGDLNHLILRCKGEVLIVVNDHRFQGLSVQEGIDCYGGGDEAKEIAPDVLTEMIRTDTLVIVQAYPHSPTGFFLAFHYDVGMAVSLVLDKVGRKR